LSLPARPQWLTYSKKQSSGAHSAAPLLPSQKIHPVREIRLGFYVGWDPESFEALNAYADKLTHVCPEWMTMADGEGNLNVNPDEKAAKLAEEKGLVLMPLLSNLADDGRFPEAVEGVANGPESRKETFIAAVIFHLKKAGAGGIVIDWGDIDPTYRDAVTTLLLKMSGAFHREQLELWLCVPAGRELKVYDLETLSSGVDRFVALLHDQNSEKDPPGPIAAEDWFAGWLQTMTDFGEPSQWVISIGSYGYDWTAGEETGEPIGFADVMTRADRAGLRAEDIETVSLNPNFVYQDAGVMHTVWFLDAATALNQMRSAMAYEVGGFALSRLGTEDPGIWKIFSIKDILHLGADDLSSLGAMKSEGITSHVGKGNFSPSTPLIRMELGN
jgi:peptidoglycan-N-acetylglucosamine deacetylase